MKTNDFDQVSRRRERDLTMRLQQLHERLYVVTTEEELLELLTITTEEIVERKRLLDLSQEL
ncbi:MAG: hypothetical protein NTV02_00185 [Candidatus Zambryskibacteria bacterium]|nr:hypothetical protein [Candidatus Zambryskibacteria bacterium]